MLHSPERLIVDYTGRWGIHEAFLHNSSGNDANVTRFDQLGHKEVPHLGYVNQPDGHLICINLHMSKKNFFAVVNSLFLSANFKSMQNFT